MPSLRQIRLATGLVLFTYVTLHFANHALGNISVEAMDDGLLVQKAIWQSPLGRTILYLSLFTHMSLGFWALYARRHFRWTRLEADASSCSALRFRSSSPIISSAPACRSSQFGLEKSYEQELLKFWVNSPAFGVLQAILLLIVWIHGCLGVHFWLRLKPFYPPVRGASGHRRASAGARAARLLPGRRAHAASPFRIPPGGRATYPPDHVGTPAQNAVLVDERTRTLAFLAAALALTFFARGVRHLARAPRGLDQADLPRPHDPRRRAVSAF